MPRLRPCLLPVVILLLAVAHLPLGAARQAQDSPGQTTVVDARVSPVWRRSSDGPVQPLVLLLQHVGEPAEAVVRIGDVEIGRIFLGQGVLQRVEVRIPGDEQPRDVRVIVDVDGRQAAARTVRVAPPRVRELWVLPHSHVDIGYTHRQEEVSGIQARNVDRAMELADAEAANPPGLRFRWNPEAAWALEQFLERAAPARREAVTMAIREGALGVDALYANILTGLCRPEELLRTVGPSIRLAAAAATPLTTAAIADVPGWTWGIVPTLAHAGVKYFAIGPNATDRVGTIHRWDDTPFYWKSQSGRERILCWVVDNYHHHGSLEAEARRHLERLERIDFAFDTAFMFWVGTWPNGTVDNAPPDEELAAKVAAWNAAYAAPRIVIGLAGEFFARFERRHGAGLPEASGDLTPYWEDGAASSSRETAMNRGSSDRLSQAETLFAVNPPTPGDAAGRGVAADLGEAWKKVLLYSEHTWGADRSISQPDDAFTLDQWKVKQGFAIDADRRSRALLSASLPPANAAISSVDVFNTTQWNRTAVAMVPAELRAAGLADEKGRVVPTQRLASGALLFVARDVRAYGARRYKLLWRPPFVEGKARVIGNVLETETLRVEIDPATGAVKSLRLRDVTDDYVDGKSPVALNDFRYVLGEDTAGATVNGPVTISVLDRGPVAASLRIESSAPGCRRLVREVRVVDGIDWVEITNTVDRLPVREKDAVHFGFGFNVPAGVVRMETPWAVVRPNEDQMPGANRNWFTVQRWLDVSNERTGITLAPLDAPLVEIGGLTAALLGPVRAQRWMERALDSQTIYSWAQNNHWHTNYKADQPGETTFRYVLRPHAGGYAALDAARFGLETSRPFVVAPSDAKQKLPRPLLAVASGEALVETVKPTEDGKGVIVRLFGVSGKDQSVTLEWTAWKPAGIWRTDLTEKRLQIVAGPIDVPAYGIVHLRVERQTR